MIRDTLSIVPADPVQSEYHNSKERQNAWQRKDKVLPKEKDTFAEILATAIKRKS